MKSIFFILLLFSTLTAEMPRIIPPPLKKGDLIALIFPAFFLNKDSLEAQQILHRKAKWLNQRGYRTIFYPNRVKMHGYLAGTDKQRAEALMAAWKNPEVKAIWCVRGGYGTPRLLDLLDYKWIQEHPKILIGMSDITALHIAIFQQTGLVTFLAPVFNSFDEKENTFDSTYAFTELEKVLLEKSKGEIRLPESEGFKVIKSGKGTGRLVGGNLTMIAALCGTKWQLDTHNKILVLEDVGEDIYRIDRLLWQIQEAGLLESPAAVILGNWKDCRANFKNSFSLQEIFMQYFGKAKYPVIVGFPSGHDKFQTTLPLNISAEVDTFLMKVTLLEKAVSAIP